jgi:N-acetylneuraminic acid mutarotase
VLAVFFLFTLITLSSAFNSSRPPTSAAATRSRDSAQTPDTSGWTIAAYYPLYIELPAVASDATYAYSVEGYSGGATNGFHGYDPVANSWFTLPPDLTALYGARAVYAADVNKIYVFGGHNGNTTFNTMQIYNVATFSWSMGAPMPAGRYLPNVAYYPGNGKIDVIGGFDPNTTEASETWEYDPVANTWNTSCAAIHLPPAGSGTSIVGQFIYLAGAYNNRLGCDGTLSL